MLKKTKKTTLFILSIIIFSCAKTKKSDLDLNQYETVDYNNIESQRQESDTTTNERIIDSSLSVTGGFYQNSKKDEIFHYNNIFVKSKELKGKWIKTIATVSFQGENRNTLILGLTTSNNKNLRGAYLMNTYIGKSNGVEIFKYEKIEGDNEEEYFTFSFGDDGKLTITDLSNGDLFIFDNKL